PASASTSSWPRSLWPKPPPSPSSTASPAKASSPPTTPRCWSTSTSEVFLHQAAAEFGQAGAEHVAQLGAGQAHLGVELFHGEGRLAPEPVVGRDHLPFEGVE